MKTLRNPKEMVIHKRVEEADKISKYKKIRHLEEQIGAGTFGTVYKYTQNGKSYALKRFTHTKEPIHITTLREIKALKAINSKYVIKIEEIIIDKDRINVVFPLYKFDLYKMLGNINFTMNEIKHIYWQILKGVEAIHDSGFIHRDLKTANILVNETPYVHICNQNEIAFYEDREDNMRKKYKTESGCYEERYAGVESSYEVCICDFGMSRTKGKNMTPGVVTLWYRAPELLLGSVSYTSAVDIWALGCILLEFFKKTPLFKADFEVDCLYMITDLCGSINEETLPGCKELPYYSRYKLNEGKRHLIEEYKHFCPKAADLADKMLTIDPNVRISIRECLNHPFFQ